MLLALGALDPLTEDLYEDGLSTVGREWSHS
jgi:hypothetical protein